MSYILDALKKLEEKRQQGAVPDLMTTHVPDPVKPGTRSIWPYVILSALLLNALLLTIWLYPWNSKRQNITEEPAAIKQAAQNAEIIIPVSKPIKEAEKKRPSSVPVKLASKPVKEHAAASSGEEPATSNIHKEERPSVKEAPDSVTKSSPETPPASTEEEDVYKKLRTASGGSVPRLEDIPSSISQDIPEISISVHIYSDSPADRMVNLNGTMRHEGDMVTSDIKLIEITESGVILSYKDSRFFKKGF